MKKLSYILSFVAVALFTAVSCEKEVAPIDPAANPAEVANCYGVYFPAQAASGDHIYSPVETPVIEITVGRTNDADAITVPVKATYSEEGIFVPEEITFAAGQKETTFKVDFANAVEGTKYAASFVIEDPQYASLYNSNPIGLDFSVMRVEMLDWLKPNTTEPAVLTLNEGWWGEVHMAKMKYYEVNGVRTCTIYSIEDGNGIWGDTQDITLQFTWYTNKSNSNDHNFLEVKKQYFGFDYADWASKPEAEAANPIYVYDYPWYWIERGYSWGDGSMQADWLAEAATTGQEDGSYPVGYYDGNGGFYFNLRYYIPGLGGFSPDPYEFVAISEGFTRVDYSFEAETDYSADGVTPVYVEAGVDVASIKYAVYEGELTPTQVGNKVAAITDGTDASTEFTAFEEDEDGKYATLLLTPETTGLYTFVAVAYNAKKEAQNSASVVFKHIAAGDVEEHAVDVSVFTEDTPARYTSYHKYDSFAYGVAGKDLTDVHVAIFKLDDVAADSGTYFNAVKADAKGTYALSAEDLAAVNGEGGFYTVATGMPAKTDLVVLVWATNGDMEDWVYATYTTDKLPYNWNSLGKGLINDGFFNYLFNNKPETTASCDVYEEAKTPGLYMVTGFQCAVAAGFFGVSEELMAQYENGNWRNAEVVIDATNPDAVTIEEQDYGILVNSSYGFFQIRSSKPGTLKDGVITFPKEGLDCYLNGYGWITANDEGTFSVTLPSAVPAAPAAAPARNGEVKDVVLTKPAVRSEESMMSFERDPQPVKVAAQVNYTRKEKTAHRELSIDVR